MPSNRSWNYNGRNAFGSASNLNSLANNAAKPLGAVNNSSTKMPFVDIDLDITLGSSGVSSTGTIELYLIQAYQNTGATDWTDGIDPASTSDVSSSLKNARCFAVLSANANSQVVRVRMQVPAALLQHFTIVPLNKTGAAFASSGHVAGENRKQEQMS